MKARNIMIRSIRVLYKQCNRAIRKYVNAIICFMVILLPALVIYFQYGECLCYDNMQSNEYGNMFVSLNAYFSRLIFMILLAIILLRRIEMGYTRKYCETQTKQGSFVKMIVRNKIIRSIRVLFKQCNRGSRKHAYTIICFSIILLVVYVICFLYGECLRSDNMPSNEYGDMFGSLNTYFSGLAFMGLLATILLQRKDLQLQRKEMRYTRKEFEAQTKQFREDSELSKRHSLESSCFDYLSYLAERKEALKHDPFFKKKGRPMRAVRGKFVSLKKLLQEIIVDSCNLEVNNLSLNECQVIKKQANDLREGLMKMGTWWSVIMLWINKVNRIFPVDNTINEEQRKQNVQNRKIYHNALFKSLSPQEKTCFVLHSILKHKFNRDANSPLHTSLTWHYYTVCCEGNTHPLIIHVLYELLVIHPSTIRGVKISEKICKESIKKAYQSYRKRMRDLRLRQCCLRMEKKYKVISRLHWLNGRIVVDGGDAIHLYYNAYCK